MSVEAVKTLQPQFNFGEAVVYPFPVQGESINYSRYTFDNVSNTNASVSLNTPGITQNVLSRNAYKQVTLRLQYNVTATGTALNTYAYQSSLTCPRRFPLASITSVESVQLNNFTTTLNLSQVVDPLSRYDQFQEYNEGLYPSIVQPDDVQNYDSSIVQSANSPFNTAPTTRENLQPRNSYPVNIVQNPLLTSSVPSGTVILEYTFYEPIMCSPFQILTSNDKSLAWVNTITYNLTFGNLTRAFSFMESAYCSSLGYAISNISASVQSCILYLKWLTIPQGLVLPDTIVYNYNRIDVYPQIIRETIPIDGNLNVNFNSTSLQSVPSDAFLVVNKTYNTTTPQDADSYLPITTLSLGWGNLQNQLANNSPFDNIRLLKENGLRANNLCQTMMLYGATNKNITSTGGSQIVYRFAAQPFKLKFAKDILASDNMVIGSTDTSTFNASVNIVNCTGKVQNANTLSLSLITVTPMQFVIGKYDNPQINQIVSRHEAAMMPVDTELSEVVHGAGLMLGGSMLGGSLWSKLKKGVSSAYKVGKNIVKTGTKILDKGEKYVMPALMAGAPELAGAYELARAAGHRLQGSGMLTDREKRKLIKQASQQSRYLR